MCAYSFGSGSVIALGHVRSYRDDMQTPLLCLIWLFEIETLKGKLCHGQERNESVSKQGTSVGSRLLPFEIAGDIHSQSHPVSDDRWLVVVGPRAGRIVVESSHQ